MGELLCLLIPLVIVAGMFASSRATAAWRRRSSSRRVELEPSPLLAELEALAKWWQYDGIGARVVAGREAFDEWDAPEALPAGAQRGAVIEIPLAELLENDADVVTARLAYRWSRGHLPGSPYCAYYLSGLIQLIVVGVSAFGYCVATTLLLQLLRLVSLPRMAGDGLNTIAAFVVIVTPLVAIWALFRAAGLRPSRRVAHKAAYRVWFAAATPGERPSRTPERYYEALASPCGAEDRRRYHLAESRALRAFLQDPPVIGERVLWIE